MKPGNVTIQFPRAENQSPGMGEGGCGDEGPSRGWIRAVADERLREGVAFSLERQAYPSDYAHRPSEDDHRTAAVFSLRVVGVGGEMARGSPCDGRAPREDPR